MVNILKFQTFFSINNIGNMKVFGLIVIINFCCVIAFSQENQPIKIDSSICDGQFFYKRKFIPKSFYTEYEKITGYKFKIVNPNRNFQERDEIAIFCRPLKRLIFLLIKDDTYILVAERGGLAKGISCIYFKYKDNNIFDMFFLEIPITEYDENSFCEIIKSEDYTIDNNSIP